MFLTLSNCISYTFSFLFSLIFFYFLCLQAVGASQDVEETIKELKKIPGFNAYLILNNDGKNNGVIE